MVLASVMDFELRLVMPAPTKVRWDLEKLARVVLDGTGRAAFVGEVEGAFKEHEEELRVLASRRLPDALWQRMRDIILPIAKLHFVTARTEEYRRDVARMRDLLVRRAAWREGAADFARHFPSIVAAIATLSRQARAVRRREEKGRSQS